MLRLRLSPEVENKTPRKACHVAVYFRIEKISEPYQRPGEAYGDAETVQYPQQVEIVFLPVMMCIPPHCEQQGDSAPVTCKPAFPRHENLPEALPAAEVIVRLIKYAVSETRPDYRTYEQGIEKGVEQFQRQALSLEKPFEYEPAQNEAGYEKEGIPPERKRAYTENLRADMPVYRKKIQHFHQNL